MVNRSCSRWIASLCASLLMALCIARAVRAASVEEFYKTVPSPC